MTITKTSIDRAIPFYEARLACSNAKEAANDTAARVILAQNKLREAMHKNPSYIDKGFAASSANSALREVDKLLTRVKGILDGAQLDIIYIAEHILDNNPLIDEDDGDWFSGDAG